MSHNPYASPEADLSTPDSADIQNGSIWKKSGRLSVLSYWGQVMLLSIVAMTLAVIVILVVQVITGGGVAALQNISEFDDINPLAFYPLPLIFLGVIWLSLCLAIKRFHDLNLSGWWVLTMYLGIGYIGLFWPGKEQSNRFGGWRSPRLWEKILGGLFVLIIILGVVGALAGFVLSLSGGLDGLGS